MGENNAAKPAGGAAMSPHAFESWSDKFNRKISENPWVPLGCAATCGALVMSAVKMKQGKSQSMNRWMRARVGLQGVTLVALVWGAMKLKEAKEAEAALALPAGLDEIAKEKAEFEERLRNAERTHAEESSIAATALANARLAKNDPQPTAAEGLAKVEKDVPPSAPSPPTSGKSWWRLW